MPVLCHHISETAANDPAQLYMVPLPTRNFGSPYFLSGGVTSEERGGAASEVIQIGCPLWVIPVGSTGPRLFARYPGKRTFPE